MWVYLLFSHTDTYVYLIYIVDNFCWSILTTYLGWRILKVDHSKEVNVMI